MLQTIKDWLQSEPKDFNAGLSLFAQHSRNRSVYLYLVRKQNMDKLTYELRKICDHLESQHGASVIASLNKIVAPVVPTIMHSGKKDDVHIENSSRIDPYTLPEAQLAIYDSVVDAHKEQRSYHEKMKLATSDDDRAALMGTIAKLDAFIADGWNQLEAFVAGEGDSGEGNIDGSEGASEIDNSDPLIVAKVVNAARKYISINLPKLAELEGDKHVEKVAAIKQRYDALIAVNATVSEETIAALQQSGVIE